MTFRTQRIAQSLATATILSAAVLSAGTAAADRPTTQSEQRGYANCVDAAADENRSFHTSGPYFINRGDASRQYYINGRAWVGDRRLAVRVACETTRSGNRVLELASAPGRFTPATEVNTYEVAAK